MLIATLGFLDCSSSTNVWYQTLLSAHVQSTRVPLFTFRPDTCIVSGVKYHTYRLTSNVQWKKGHRRVWRMLALGTLRWVVTRWQFARCLPTYATTDDKRHRCQMAILRPQGESHTITHAFHSSHFCQCLPIDAGGTDGEKLVWRQTEPRRWLTKWVELLYQGLIVVAVTHDWQPFVPVNLPRNNQCAR